MARYNYYYQSQLIKHTPYIIGIAISIILIIFISYTSYNNYNSLVSQINTLEGENSKLDSTAKTLEAFKNSNINDIRKYNIMLLRLIPSKEDYFSIIQALDTLSENTNFIITDYRIEPTNNSELNKLSLNVVGEGSQEAFLKFLGKYTVGGGRLITTDQLKYNTSQFGSTNQFNLSLNFYIDKPTTPSANLNVVAAKATMDKLRILEGQIYVKPSTQEATSINYDTGPVGF